MTDSALAAHRRFVGNACLYQALADRNAQPFLQRNLNRVLDGHERVLHAPPDTMIANERRRAGWDFPTVEMWEDLMKGHRPKLKVDSMQLRLADGREGNVRKTPASMGNGDDPDWLRAPDIDLEISGRVQLRVQEGQASKKIGYQQSQTCTIFARRDDDGERFFDVEFSAPFFVELSEFFVVLKTGTGPSRWKQTATANHFMEVSLQCVDPDATAEFLSRIEDKDLSWYENEEPRGGILRATWSRLPECPSELLPLKRAKGHKSLHLPYGLDVSMGWCRQKDSPFVTFNRMRTTLQDQQLPTPSGSDDLEKIHQNVVEYNFQEGAYTRSHTAYDLKCIWCTATHELSTVERLHLHYALYHPYFRFQREGPIRSNEHDTTKFTFSLDDKQFVNPGSDDPAAEWTWVAPERPFDSDEYLRGDESWITGHVKVKPAGRRGRPPKVQESKSTSASTSQQRSIPRGGVSSRPSDVQDLPQLEHRRYKVPNSSGTQFYHATSKQPIEPHTVLHDEDDDLVDTRLKHHQRRNFAELGLADAKIEFNETFNRHMDNERSESGKLAGDAVIRFARKYALALSDDRWRGPFKQKLALLKRYDIIGEDVITACLSVPSSHPVDEPMTLNPLLNDQNSGDSLLSRRTRNGLTTRDHGDDDDGRPSPAIPRGRRGRLTKSRDTNEEDLYRSSLPPDTHAQSGDADSETEIEDISPRPRKKPHKWSGGGVDKETVEEGRRLFNDTTRTILSPIKDIVEPRRLYSKNDGDGNAAHDDGNSARSSPKAPGFTPTMVSRAHSDQPASSSNGQLDDNTTHITPDNRLNEGHDRTQTSERVCFCGKPVQGTRGTVACDNPRCKRGNFHLACVSVDQRIIGWTCDDCR